MRWGPGCPGRVTSSTASASATIWPNRQYRHVARAVVGDQQKAPAGVDGLVHAIAAAGFGAIQWLQQTGIAIHRKRTGIGFIAVYRIEVTLIRGHHEE